VQLAKLTWTIERTDRPDRVGGLRARQRPLAEAGAWCCTSGDVLITGMHRLWGGARGWWLVAGSAAALAGVSALARSLPAAVASIVVAVAGAIAGVYAARGAAALTDQSGAGSYRAGGLWVNKHGRFPHVCDIVDPVLVGVHRAAVTPLAVSAPPFIARDRDAELVAAIAAGGFVVVVGESTAGKSRAAFEAIQSAAPRHTFIRPIDRSAVPAAVRAARRFQPAVLWLDDLEQYLGSGGLTAHLLTELVAAGQRVSVVATMRAQEHARYSPRGDATGDPAAGGTARQGRAVLDLATEIRLDRQWSATELVRAEAHRDDARIADALRFGDRYGIAEYLAAGPQLLGEWHDGWAPGTHPRGAALVAAAVDARRAGYQQPLPLAVLRPLHEHYLRERGGPALRPEPWDSALAWAQQQVHATTSLLGPHGDDRYMAFDYLPDAVDAEAASPPVPEPVWAAVIDLADPVTATDIGWIAYVCRCWSAAETAFQQALNGGQVAAANGLASVFGYGRLDYSAAISVLRSALASTDERVGIDPGDLLDLRSQLAWWLGAAGQGAEALALIQQVAADAATMFGSDDRRTLSVRVQVARWTGETGNPDGALRLAQQVFADHVRRFGVDDEMTLSSRFEVAIWTGEAGNPRQAVDMLAALEVDFARVLGPVSRAVFDARRNLAYWLTRAGDVEAALRLRRNLVTDVAAAYGSRHPRTLRERLDLAWSTNEAGQPAEALRLTDAVAAEAATALGTDHPLTLLARSRLAALESRS
jgi:Tetratricopeptide repeat